MKTRWLRNFLVGLLGAVVIGLGLSLFTATTATPSFYYSITKLGSSGNLEDFTWGINDAGQVISTAFGWSSFYRAFVWNNGARNGLPSVVLIAMRGISTTRDRLWAMNNSMVKPVLSS